MHIIGAQNKLCLNHSLKKGNKNQHLKQNELKTTSSALFLSPSVPPSSSPGSHSLRVLSPLPPSPLFSIRLHTNSHSYLNLALGLRYIFPRHHYFQLRERRCTQERRIWFKTDNIARWARIWSLRAHMGIWMSRLLSSCSANLCQSPRFLHPFFFWIFLNFSSNISLVEFSQIWYIWSICYVWENVGFLFILR